MQETGVAPRTHRFRNFVIFLLLLLGAYGAGYIPERMARSRTTEELNRLTFDHDLSELHRRLGVASHEAMRNNYASAAQSAQVFFEKCNDVLQKYPFENEPRTKYTLSTFANSRDAIMTQLATGDPASRERLMNMFLALDGVLTRRQ
jgi:hypothetical protein